MPKWVYSEIPCKMCGRSIKKNCFSRHVRSCNGPIEIKKRKAWNKGLSKADPRVATIASKVSKSLTGKKGKSPSKKARMKLSIHMSERLKQSYADGTRKQVGGYCKFFEVDGVKVQGTWEKRAAEIFSKWKRSGKILNWQHGITRIPYHDDFGNERIYIVDFTITQCDGSEYLVEVKGRKSLCDPVKWDAARKKFKLEIWTLREIIHHETSM